MVEMPKDGHKSEKDPGSEYVYIMDHPYRNELELPAGLSFNPQGFIKVPVELNKRLEAIAHDLVTRPYANRDLETYSDLEMFLLPFYFKNIEGHVRSLQDAFKTYRAERVAREEINRATSLRELASILEMYTLHTHHIESLKNGTVDPEKIQNEYIGLRDAILRIRKEKKTGPMT